MSLAHTAVQRSLENMTFKMSLAGQKKTKSTGAFQQSETFQEYQVDVTLQAGAQPIWDEVTIKFDEIFYDAPGQRNSNLSEPHFTYGLVLDPPAPDFFYSVVVSDWDTDAQGDFIGATVRMGVYNPTLVQPSGAKGRLHLTFQGYSAPADNAANDNVGQI